MTFAEVKAVADTGNAQAQFELGERFHFGRGVPKDSTEAVSWWQKAAVQKFPQAEVRLGVAYGEGDGVPKNEQEGIKLFQAAADSGLPLAQVALGSSYFFGDAVPKNYQETFRWFKAAANQGWPPAQYYVALCYRDGKGTQASSDEAVVWLQRAAGNGLANAQDALGEYYYQKGLTEIASQLGISVSDNNRPTQAQLNTPLTKEQHDNPNFFRGVEWIRKAANQGYPKAQGHLALACAYGFGTDKDSVEACKWLTLESAKESNVVMTVIQEWKTNNLTFTPEQMTAGKKRAEEFSKTNHVVPKEALEISNL